MRTTIKAKVQFNCDTAYVLNKAPVIKYNEYSTTSGQRLLIGTDGLFYKCFINYAESGAKAFAGREIHITMADGTERVLKDTWWDGGYDIAEFLLNIRLENITAASVKDLKDCYVFYSYRVDITKWEKITRKHITMPVQLYWEYEREVKKC